jgi:hypothetical protein
MWFILRRCQRLRLNNELEVRERKRSWRALNAIRVLFWSVWVIPWTHSMHVFGTASRRLQKKYCSSDCRRLTLQVCMSQEEWQLNGTVVQTLKVAKIFCISKIRLINSTNIEVWAVVKYDSQNVPFLVIILIRLKHWVLEVWIRFRKAATLYRVFYRRSYLVTSVDSARN